MVKGVNKHIIEINDTGNKYFEKVLLFITPGKKDFPEEILHAKAREYLFEITNNADNDLNLRELIRRKRAKKKILVISGAIVVIALTAVMIFNIF